MQLPSGWDEVEQGDDRLCAALRHDGERYEVECTRHGRSWTGTVTVVRPNQRHRVALVQRPSLDDAVVACQRVLAHQ